MGAATLSTLHYSDAGIGYTFGQSYTPGAPWPKITIHAQTWTINYDAGAMRDEVTLSRAEPRGGGGYPQLAQQKNDQFVNGAFAWNQGATGPASGPRYVSERVHQLWITPHGIIKAALRNRATLVGGAWGCHPANLTGGDFCDTPGTSRVDLFGGVKNQALGVFEIEALLIRITSILPIQAFLPDSSRRSGCIEFLDVSFLMRPFKQPAAPPSHAHRSSSCPAASSARRRRWWTASRCR